MMLGAFLLSTLTAILVLHHGAEGISVRGSRPGNANFPLTNNSVYTVPPDLNVWPLMLCSGDDTTQSIEWLHLNESSLSRDGWEAPFYQYHDSQAHPGPHVGLYRGNGHTLTAYNEQVMVCQVTTSGSGEVERLFVRVQLPRAPPAKPELTDSGRVLSVHGATLPTMDCIVGKHITPYPSIAWFKDNTQLKPGPNVRMETSSTQDLRLRLTLTNFTADARGLYYCVAKNGLGETRSDTVYLDLEGFPAVYTTNEIVYFTPGEDLTLRVSAAQYKSLHWSFTGTRVGVGGTWELGAGEYTLEDFNQTVVVHNSTVQHEGYYMVQASSSEEVDPLCVVENAVTVCAGRVAVLQAVARAPSSVTDSTASPATVAIAASNHGSLSSTNVAVIACATVSGVLLGVIIAAACTFFIVAMRRRRQHSKATAAQNSPPLAVANPYSTRKLPSVRASVISEDNLYQVVHPKGTRSRSRSPLPPSASAKVGGEIQHYAEGFGDTGKNLQQAGYMTMGGNTNTTKNLQQEGYMTMGANCNASTTKNLQQAGYMTMGSCAAMLDLPTDAPPMIKVIDSEVECD